MNAFVLDILRRAFDDGPWHGPALRDVLADVDAPTALARPIDDAHTIWELTHHLAAWTAEVARRVAGARPAMPPEGDFPAPFVELNDATAAADWAALRARLDAARDALLAAVSSIPAERFDAPIGTTDHPDGDGELTVGRMLVGVAEHTAYHAGQITLLRRALTRRAEATTITES